MKRFGPQALKPQIEDKSHTWRPLTIIDWVGICAPAAIVFSMAAAHVFSAVTTPVSTDVPEDRAPIKAPQP